MPEPDEKRLRSHDFPKIIESPESYGIRFSLARRKLEAKPELNTADPELKGRKKPFRPAFARFQVVFPKHPSSARQLARPGLDRGQGIKRWTAPEGTMECIQCQTMKSLQDFYLHPAKNGRRYYDSRCDPCRKKHGVAKRYRLTIEQYDELISQSDGHCAICGQSYGKPNIDHCHSTGKIRGILCTRCNSGISIFDKHPELFHKALEYLSRPYLKPIYPEARGPRSIIRSPSD